MSSETLNPPKKAPPPPPKPAPPAAKATSESSKTFGVSSGRKVQPIKACIYGTGGIGKSELAANITHTGLSALFIDTELGSGQIDCTRAEGVENMADLHGILRSDLPLQYDAIICDSLTNAEEWNIAWVLANVPHEKGLPIKSIEDYGFGKGVVHNYEAFLTLLNDFDALMRRGKHIITVAHECTQNVPNPAGEDYIRWEPRLQSPKSGQNSIRHRVKEWCDHLLYVGYDVSAKDGKAQGAGTRCIYPTEMPAWWAKSRKLSEPIPYTKGSAALWELLLERNA